MANKNNPPAGFIDWINTWITNGAASSKHKEEILAAKEFKGQ